MLISSSDCGGTETLSDEERYLCGLVGTVGNYEELKEYLETVNNIDITCIVDGSGYTLLHLAIYHNSYEITKLLCQHVRYINHHNVD
jgi:ankyrin repeat protein